MDSKREAAVPGVETVTYFSMIACRAIRSGKTCRSFSASIPAVPCSHSCSKPTAPCRSRGGNFGVHARPSHSGVQSNAPNTGVPPPVEPNRNTFPPSALRRLLPPALVPCHRDTRPRRLSRGRVSCPQSLSKGPSPVRVLHGLLPGSAWRTITSARTLSGCRNLGRSSSSIPVLVDRKVGFIGTSPDSAPGRNSIKNQSWQSGLIIASVRCTRRADVTWLDRMHIAEM